VENGKLKVGHYNSSSRFPGDPDFQKAPKGVDANDWLVKGPYFLTQEFTWHEINRIAVDFSLYPGGYFNGHQNWVRNVNNQLGFVQPAQGAVEILELDLTSEYQPKQMKLGFFNRAVTITLPAIQRIQFLSPLGASYEAHQRCQAMGSIGGYYLGYGTPTSAWIACVVPEAGDILNVSPEIDLNLTWDANARAANDRCQRRGYPSGFPTGRMTLGQSTEILCFKPGWANVYDVYGLDIIKSPQFNGKTDWIRKDGKD